MPQKMNLKWIEDLSAVSEGLVHMCLNCWITHIKCFDNISLHVYYTNKTTLLVPLFVLFLGLLGPPKLRETRTFFGFKKPFEYPPRKARTRRCPGISSSRLPSCRSATRGPNWSSPPRPRPSFATLRPRPSGKKKIH